MLFSSFRERNLVNRAHYDTAAFDKLYKLHIKDVYQYIFSKVHSQHDAEDITSEVWTKVVLAFPTFEHKHDATFKSWLFTIAYNTVIDFFRNKQRLFFPDTDCFDRIAGTDNTEENAIKQLLWIEIIKAIVYLPEKQQECIRLRFIAELPNKEIAYILNINEKTVASNIVRGIEKLKGIIKGLHTQHAVPTHN